MASLHARQVLGHAARGGSQTRSTAVSHHRHREPISPAQIASAAPALRRAGVSDLQRVHGNAYVQRFLNRSHARHSPAVRRQPAIQRAPGANPMLRVGSRGAAVSTLQQQLNSAGAAVTADGVFGPGTRHAVVAFQQAAGLTPDGVVGPQTWQRLQSGAPASEVAAAPGDPRQAILVAKLGQVRAALQGVNAKSGGDKTAPPPSGDKVAGAPIQGEPIPSCGVRLPTGEGPTQIEHVATGMVQRSILDDASEWLDEKTDAAGEWVDDKVGAAATAIDDAADWAGDKVDAAGEWVDEKTSAAGQVVDDAVNSATTFVEEEVSQAAESVQEIVGGTREVVEGGIDKAVEVATGIAQDVGELSEDLQKRLAAEIATVKEVAEAIGNALPKDFDDLVKKLDDVLKGLSAVDPRNLLFWGPFDDPEPATPSKIYGLLDVTSKVERGGVKVPGGTGYSEPKFSIDNVSWWRAVDDIVIQARLNIECHWEIASEGRGVSISSGNDAAVKEDTYLTIIHDLAAMSESYKSGGGVITSYWSEPLIARHEQFHCRDYIGEAVTYLPTAQTWLEAQMIPNTGAADDEILKQVQAHLEAMRFTIEKDNMEYFKNGGEARAYGDGKGSYDALIAAIKARAKKEKWKGLDSVE